MTRAFLKTLIRRYRAYVDSFRDARGGLSELHRLKIEHTERVAENACRIMSGENWPEAWTAAGEACAWLHDIGRHVQLRDYGTFRDADSLDHAACGVAVIHEERLLDGLAAASRARILAAVALHNRKTVPDGLADDAARLTHLVRDADKLDIFRVLEEVVDDGSLRRNPAIAWELRLDGAPSPDVVAAVCAGQPVSYDAVRNLSDFVLIQVGWLINGLHYTASLRLAAERRVLEYREAFLKTLSTDAGVTRCCDAARRHFAAKAVGA